MSGHKQTKERAPTELRAECCVQHINLPILPPVFELRDWDTRIVLGYVRSIEFVQVRDSCLLGCNR